MSQLATRAKQLRQRDGFDKSFVLTESQAIRVRCSQCEAAVINGVACHETGCPNIKRNRRDDDDDE